MTLRYMCPQIGLAANKSVCSQAFMHGMELARFCPYRSVCPVSCNGAGRENFDKAFCTGVWGGTRVMK